MFKKKEIHEHIILIDPYFPQKEIKSWRDKLINDFFDVIPKFKFYFSPNKKQNIFMTFLKTIKTTIFVFIKDKKFVYKKPKKNFDVSISEFQENKELYYKKYPQNIGKILFLDKKLNYKVDLAIFIFINSVYMHISFLEKNKIPFLFILYPRGGFHVNSENSDKKLKRVCRSKFFRGVLVTNAFVKGYLLKKNICSEEKIIQLKYQRADIERSQIKKKKKYLEDKDSFDLAFVAFKYMEKGLDKGYDLFIETALNLSKKYPDMHFHVVGNFDESDIDVSNLKNRITFYGVRDTKFLIDFYSRIDIFLSPNRPFVLNKGAFDGFPLGGTHAQICGVALFVTDELNLNESYSKDEIVIIKPNVKDIEEKIEKYYNNPALLYKLSKKGQKKDFVISNKNFSDREFLSIFDNAISSQGC